MKNTLATVFLADSPDKHIREMKWNGKLDAFLPEVSRLHGVPQPKLHHPEGDAFEHSVQVLAEMKKQTRLPERLFAGLVHDVGKGTTPIELLPKHHNHEKNGVPVVEELCNRLGVPEDWRNAALYGTEHHGTFHRILEMRPPKLVDFLKSANNSALGIEGLAQLGLADHRGRNNPNGTHECFDAWFEMWEFIEKNPGMPHERKEDVRMRHANGIKEIQQRHKNG